MRINLLGKDTTNSDFDASVDRWYAAKNRRVSLKISKADSSNKDKYSIWKVFKRIVCIFGAILDVEAKKKQKKNCM